MDLTDREYVQRCCDGHPEDFRILVYRYGTTNRWFVDGGI